MSTVGGVNELAVGMNQNFGGGIKGFSCFHFFTDGGSGGKPLGCSFFGIPCESSYGQTELIEQINEFPIG